MKNNNTLQVIYTYLINNIEKENILELTHDLLDYVINDNYIDYEITTNDYSDMFEEMVRDNLYTSKDSLQNMIYALENVMEEFE